MTTNARRVGKVVAPFDPSLVDATPAARFNVAARAWLDGLDVLAAALDAHSEGPSAGLPHAGLRAPTIDKAVAESVPWADVVDHWHVDVVDALATIAKDAARIGRRSGPSACAILATLAREFVDGWAAPAVLFPNADADALDRVTRAAMPRTVRDVLDGLDRAELRAMCEWELARLARPADVAPTDAPRDNGARPDDEELERLTISEFLERRGLHSADAEAVLRGVVSRNGESATIKELLPPTYLQEQVRGGRRAAQVIDAAKHFALRRSKGKRPVFRQTTRGRDAAFALRPEWIGRLVLDDVVEA